MPQHNKLFLTDVKYSSVSSKEWDHMQETAIKKWHFEKVKGGVIPVSDETVVDNNH